MEEKEKKKTDASRAGVRRTIISAVAFMLLLAFAAAGISVARGAHFRRSAAELTPAPLPGAAWNAAEPSADPLDTPEPTEAPTEAPTGEPTLQPFAKTEIFVDGRSVAVIASREAAEDLLFSVETYFGTMGDIPADAVTEPDCRIEIWPAPDSAQSMSYDAAYAYLTGENTPLRYRSVANYVEERVIPHTETVYEDPKLMRGLRIVNVYGRDGLERTVYRTVYINGVKQRPETETYTVIGPVNGEVAVGTRDYGDDFVLTPDFGSNPVAAYSFDFISPVRGEVDKFFGPYDGGFHHGIDVACDAGEEVLAACAGKVVSVMERGAYGLLVEIEHGNSVSTRYARLSSACVSIGDKVSQGDVLGYAEDTAEQAHLHFELRIGGTAYNPLKILSAGDIIG